MYRNDQPMAELKKINPVLGSEGEIQVKRRQPLDRRYKKQQYGRKRSPLRPNKSNHRNRYIWKQSYV